MKGAQAEAAEAAANVGKLPKWAQAYIERLVRERDDAMRKLRDYCDTQTPSPVWYDEHLFEDGTWTTVKRYVQTERVVVQYAGTKLTMLCRRDATQEGDAIDLQYEDAARTSGVVNLQPRSYQSMYIWRKQ